MAAKNIAVFGIYKYKSQTEDAIDAITAAGFSRDDISILFPDDRGPGKFGDEEELADEPHGAIAGGSTGGIIGGTLGMLAGFGSIAVPGIGPLIAAGPILGTLLGFGVGGVVGGIVGTLVRMGVPEYEARRYEGQVREGGILLSVHCNSSDDVSRAAGLLGSTGASDISTNGEKSVSTGIYTDNPPYAEQRSNL